MLHGPDGEVETVVDYQAVRLGRRREGRKHLARRSRLSRASLAGGLLPQGHTAICPHTSTVKKCSIAGSSPLHKEMRCDELLSLASLPIRAP